MNYYIEVWKRVFDYKGRSTRMEFWMFIVINMAIVMGLYAVSSFIPFLFAIAGMYSLISYVPTISLAVRRLHDINLNGWFSLVIIIPFWGFLFGIFLGVIKSKPENKYGPNPTEVKN